MAGLALALTGCGDDGPRPKPVYGAPEPPVKTKTAPHKTGDEAEAKTKTFGKTIDLEPPGEGPAKTGPAPKKKTIPLEDQ